MLIKHYGRITVIIITNGKIQIARLREALTTQGFILTFENNKQLKMRRRAYIQQNDWPISLCVLNNGKEVKISYYLFIPWGWLIFFLLINLVMLPILTSIYASIIGTFILFLLALIKRRFDCRPNAIYWQAASRSRWHTIITNLIRQSYGE